MEPSPMTLTTEPVNGSALVTVVGDVDLSSADRFRQELESALKQFRLVMVDVAQMTFIDSSGLNALVRAHRIALATDGELRLRHPRPMLLQLLSITRLETVLVVEDQDCGSVPPSPDPMP